MCEYCENMNDLSKTIPLIRFGNETIAYLFNGNLYIDESKSTRKYNVKINYCPICGRKITKAEDAAEVKPVIHAHAIINWLGNAKCSNCGSANIDVTEPYCQHCGARLDEPEERID